MRLPGTYISPADIGLYYLQSRYYDSEIGRFLNADSQTDSGASTIGFNLFAYAANNPVNNSDPTGHWIIKNAIKWVANKAKSALSNLKDRVSTKRGTFNRSYGANVSGGMMALSVQIGISVDRQGGIAVHSTKLDGVALDAGGCSAVATRTITNAYTVDDLTGLAISEGVGLGAPIYGVPVVAGIDFCKMNDTTTGEIYYGGSYSTGLGCPGLDVHSQYAYTNSLISFNIFDEAEEICDKILEW